MTKEEVNEFFDKVKDKKLTKSNWEKGDFFIPNNLYIDSFNIYTMRGIYIIKDIEFNFDFWVNYGFDDDFNGNKWILLDEPNLETPQNNICTCDITTLMRFGCKCGAFQKEKL